MSRLTQRTLAGAAACLVAHPLTVWAEAGTPAAAPAQPNTNIFDPERAPIIVIHIGIRRYVLTPVPQGSSTTITSAAIAQKANQSFNSIITASVPGAAAAPSGEIHIRGSHGQYTYYLDGAPLPESVSGSFGELIDPKNIEALRVYTGGFPARYGGNLAAVFDVTAKGGRPGPPTGSVQQTAEGYQTYESTAQAGGGAGNFSYFFSGIRSTTNRRLDPVTPEPLHDAGSDDVLFLHSDLRSSAQDRLTLDAAKTDSLVNIPNTVDEQNNGRADVQRENGNFANLIWRRTHGENSLLAAVYNNNSRLRYDPSTAADLKPIDNVYGTATTEDRTATYDGFRTDYTIHHGKDHVLHMGMEGDTVTGHEFFQVVSGDGTPPSVDSHKIGGNDEGAYLSEDWTPGRWLLDMGARYDIHTAQTTSSQLSPRFNATYTASRTDKFHAYYDRLFEPTAIEEVKSLSASVVQGTITPIQPERSNFYEVGWLHHQDEANYSISAYYKTQKNVVDDQVLGNTQIDIPINITKGYVRGIEFAADRPLSKTLSGYANYARSWARAAGNISGGLSDPSPSQPYFPVDHDQTETASLGLNYQNAGTFASLDGEYGSGFPYQDEYGVYRRVSPHFIFNMAAGQKMGAFQFAVTVDNILNHGYIIKQASQYSDQEYGAPRTYGARLTFSF